MFHPRASAQKKSAVMSSPPAACEAAGDSFCSVAAVSEDVSQPFSAPLTDTHLLASPPGSAPGSAPGSPLLPPSDSDWELDYILEASTAWQEVGSNETDTTHNIVAAGTIGAEYLALKAAKGGDSAKGGASSSPPSDAHSPNGSPRSVPNECPHSPCAESPCAESPCTVSTPQRDPYHGRSVAPRLMREPARESFRCGDKNSSSPHTHVAPAPPH